jgi:hypothetical protein
MSATQIKDGKGTGFGAAVDKNNQLHTFSVTEGESQQANTLGNAYNINTGEISLSTASAIIYFKNNESENFVVDSIAIGVSNGTVSDIGVLTLHRNPTGGTLISAASNVSMNENRNFGSSNVLSDETLAYKGVSGSTVTGGEEIALFYHGDNSRLFATIDFELTKGSSLALHYDPKLSSGSLNVYAALIGYVKSANNNGG